MDAIDEIVAEFLVESHENLDQLDRDLLALEQNPDSRELLASVFRTIHTIKGTSGFLAFHKLEKLTHVGESLLSRLRDGKISLNEERTSALLRMVDAVRGLLAEIESTGAEGDATFDELATTLSAMLEDRPAAAAPGANTQPVEASAPVAASVPAAPAAPAGKSQRVAAATMPATTPPTTALPEPRAAAERGAVPAEKRRRTTRTRAKVPAVAEIIGGGPAAAQPVPVSMPDDASVVPAPVLGEVLVSSGATTPAAVEIARMEQDLGDERPIGAILVDHGQTTRGAVEQALETQATQAHIVPAAVAAAGGGGGRGGGDSHDGRRSVVDSSVRVDVELLDSLMRLVGELVLARNQLVSRLDDAHDNSLARSAQRLSLVTSELQEQVMKTRMQPVDAVWSKMPRIVRDLAKQCGRQLRLEMEGRETELDRSVLEAIRDPLTHLVRNAVDHGIEAPADRRATGKPGEGVLKMRAYHEAGQVHLEIIDDGAGIDPAQVGAKAVERGVISPAQLASMSNRELLQLIFLPGFSLAKKITNVSGRGVGMDVVKTRIEGIGGSVDVASKLGVGTTFRLTIPLTLAIIPALTIGCDRRRYAVPQVSVLELVRLNGEHARGGIELISGAPVYRLRDMLLPLVRLDEQLGLVPFGHEFDPSENRGGFIVVLHAEQQRFGLVVDDVLDTQEIVVKPLGRHLKGIPVYAGATILGDGTVVLILDAATLARRANVLQSGTGATVDQKAVEAEPIDPVLVVGISGDRRAAIPLDMVTRLEEIPQSSMERVGGREVVQYRGHIMPLVRLSNLLGAYGDSAGEGDGVQLVVYTRGQRSVGFVVERILDIATERSGTRSDIDDHALIGSVVVGDRVVELLDVQAAVLAADPNFYDAQAGEAGQGSTFEEARR